MLSFVGLPSERLPWLLWRLFVSCAAAGLLAAFAYAGASSEGGVLLCSLAAGAFSSEQGARGPVADIRRANGSAQCFFLRRSRGGLAIVLLFS